MAPLVNNPHPPFIGGWLNTLFIMEQSYFVELVYNDESEMNFEVRLDGTDTEIMAHLMMITRGTLMASLAVKATAYNDQGFVVCSYLQ